MKTIEELRTPEKLAQHQAEDAKPETKFLLSPSGMYQPGSAPGESVRTFQPYH